MFLHYINYVYVHSFYLVIFKACACSNCWMFGGKIRISLAAIMIIETIDIHQNL